jgi:hypothetical protein
MQAIRARLAAILASFLLAGLSSLGVRGLTPELGAEVQAWVDHTFELALLLGYAVIHPWLQARLNPTGAFTREAARGLEHAAHVREGL